MATRCQNGLANISFFCASPAPPPRHRWPSPTIHAHQTCQNLEPELGHGPCWNAGNPIDDCTAYQCPDYKLCGSLCLHCPFDAVIPSSTFTRCQHTPSKNHVPKRVVLRGSCGCECVGVVLGVGCGVWGVERGAWGVGRGAWRGVAWRGVSWRGVAWRGVVLCVGWCVGECVGWCVGWCWCVGVLVGWLVGRLALAVCACACVGASVGAWVGAWVGGCWNVCWSVWWRSVCWRACAGACAGAFAGGGAGGAGGARDLENGVSIQARSYMQLTKRQQELLQEAESVRDLSCSDRSLVSDKLVNQPLYEEKGKEANHPQSS